MRKTSILIIFLVFLLNIVFMFSVSFAIRLESLRHVDLIGVSAYEKDGVLRISVLYKNRFEDESVYWSEGTVDCYCEIYENIGNILDKKKGPGIIGIRKTLHSFFQDFYVDMPGEYLNKGKRGIIECTFDTEYEKLRATGEFSLGESSAPQRSQHFNIIREERMNPEKALKEKYKIWTDEEGVVHVEEIQQRE